MIDRLLALAIRGHLTVAGLARDLSSRARGERGQATVEWLAMMVGLAALVTLLAGKDVWHRAGEEIVRAVDAILQKPASDEKV